MVDNFLSLLGGALGEPVVTEQYRDLVCVHQLPRHEGQRAKRHLFIAQRMEKEQTENRLKQSRWQNADMKVIKKEILVTVVKNIYFEGLLLQS